MINRKRVLAVIPARGGSKRLPRKNVLDLAGKPLIAWSIESALESQYIDRVVVSTDDDEVATISTKYGADVPFMRPAELALDETKSIDTVLHTINTLESLGDKYEVMILLQPTSPLREVSDIDNSIFQLDRRGDKSVVSVCEAEHSPLWANTLPEDHSMDDFLSDEVINCRSQDLPVYYRLNGAIYVMSITSMMSMPQPSFFSKEGCSAFVMPTERSIDIDTQLELLYAEVYIKRILSNPEFRNNTLSSC